MKTLLLALTLVGVSPLAKDEFEKLHEEVQPDKSELWRTIPWQTSLLKAQAIAGREKKPLFIWAMDGHPLGCT